MTRQVTITVDFDDQGIATIRIPAGATQRVNAAAAEDLTDKLSKALGKVLERHRGDHHHHHDDADHVHDKD